LREGMDDICESQANCIYDLNIEKESQSRRNEMIIADENAWNLEFAPKGYLCYILHK
jgi:hypothetical protein